MSLNVGVGEPREAQRGEAAGCCRNAWILVREHFLCSDDLRLIYAVLNGQLAVPPHWRAALHDALALLTRGLDPMIPLRLVAVPGTFSVPLHTGGGRLLECVRHFLSHSVGQAEGGDMPPKPERLGMLSVEAAAELVVALRREIAQYLGGAA